MLDSKDLWKNIKSKILEDCKKNEGVLIFDDTISEKPHSKLNKINTRCYNHAKGIFMKGINILTCYYSGSVEN